MTVCPRNVGVLCALLVVLLSEPGTADVSPEVTETNCPALTLLKCKRGIKSDTQYIKVYSAELNAMFLCDTKTDGGGWIIIQRRVTKLTNFNQKWTLYKNGFGPLCGDHWLGNRYIHQLTRTGNYELRFDMQYKTKQYFAHYREFVIDGEQENYRLHVGGFNGNTFDEFAIHNNMMFSTRDKDNDIHQNHCAEYHLSGWWFGKCHTANINGDNSRTGKSNCALAIQWRNLTYYYDTLDLVEMKVRKINE